ncbi:hypothetical protein D3C86_391910 [compost metagenome]
MDMTRFLRMMMIALALLLMGARDLPRPCLGDGMGNACAIAQCQCTDLCSCRSVCGLDASSTALDEPSCHMHASEDPAANPGHFSLPEPQPPTLLIAASRWLPPRQFVETPAFAPDPYLSLNLSPPEPPPRIRA